MVRATNIKWKNIFYMLCYAIEELYNFEYEDIDIEDVEGVNDLLVKLLINSTQHIVENGLFRSYKDTSIITDKPFGKIDITQSYNSGAIPKGQLCCDVELLDSNNCYNKIIKASIKLMLHCNYNSSDKIKQRFIQSLNYLYDGFNRVDDIELDNSILDNLDLELVGNSYKSVLAVCKLIIESWLLTDKHGEHRLLNLSNNERLKYIFERFVRNFYKLECKDIKTTRPKYTLPTQGDRVDYNVLDMLLERGSRGLVIDTKWYDSSKNSNSNEMQVSEYGQSYLRENKGKGKTVVSLLIYADSPSVKEKGLIHRDVDKRVPVYMEKLDINQDFKSIKQNLIDIAEKYLTIV